MRPLTIPHFLFRREKGSEKACGRTRFGQIPLIAHLENGARDTRPPGVGCCVLCLASCQRARLIHFPNGRGICLRFVWPPCRAAWVSSSFGLREGVGCASLWVVGCAAKGYPSPPSAELPSAEGSRGVARGAISCLRRGTEGWWIAKERFWGMVGEKLTVGLLKKWSCIV